MTSCECSKSELDLFTVPPTNTSMEKGNVIEKLPISSLGDGPIEFQITPEQDEYIDVGRTFLYLKVKITKKDKSDLEATSKVGPVNLLFHTLWSQIDVHLNDKLITPSENTYPYKAYLETLLSYGYDAKASQLASQLWYDDVGSLNSIDPYDETDPVNTGFVERSKLFSTSKSVEMYGRLHCDIFQQERYLPHGVKMKIKLTPSSEAFHLMSDTNAYTTVIQDASLFVRMVKLNPAIPNMHNTKLNQGKLAQYPIRRGIVTTFTIPQGHLSKTEDNVIMGQLPRRLVIGLVTNKAFNGSKDANPFEFKHFDLNYLTIHVGGQQFPGKALTPDFDNDQCLRSYMTLFEGTGMLNADKGNYVSRASYKNGFTLYAFDLTADMMDGDHIDPIKQGNVKMEFHFKEVLTETVNVVAYAEYDNILQIDRARNIVTDF